MAPQTKPSAPAGNGSATTDGKRDAEKDQDKEESLPIGPQSGLSFIPTQFIHEQRVRQMLLGVGYNEAQEDQLRIKGVQLIDNVRQSLQLPVKTFDTAATYYHKFRIRYPSEEYNYEDVALASLFVACKVEDTIKKSKDILCAAHNLRHHDNKTPDDKHFEGPSKFTIGLERHILETIGFDFRGQYPQKYLIKMVRTMFPRDSSDPTEAQKFLRVAYDMSIDLYKTFAPIKQSTSTLVMAILEVTALFLGNHMDKVEAIKSNKAWQTNRGCVLETMLDLMDLYTQFPKSTKVGSQFDINRAMDIKIELNKLVANDEYQRYFGWCDECLNVNSLEHSYPVTPGSATSLATTSSVPGASAKRTVAKSGERTMRFVFNSELAHKERDLVSMYFKEEYEEYEMEVDEPIKEQATTEPARGPRSSQPSHRSGGGHHGNNDHGWGPYHRSRPGGHHGDRHSHKGRKGGGGGYYH
ncbi:CTD kinase subunit beta [Naviculisporaceae sp. PSN 640]